MRYARASFVLIGLLAHPLHAAERPVVHLRVGLVAFNAPTDPGSAPSAAPTSTDQLVRYLEAVSSASASAPPPAPVYEFDTFIGNYYQVMSWLRSGDLDAAFVSAFTAMVLVGDEQGERIRRVLEVAPRDPETGEAAAGHQVAAHRQGVPSPDPVQDLNRYIELAWEASEAKTEPLDLGPLKSYDVLLVTHLSTTGFIAPIAYVERQLVRLQMRSPSEGTHARLDRFWRIFFRNVRLQMRHGSRTLSRERIQIAFTYSGQSRKKLTARRYADPADAQPLLSAWVPLSDLVSPSFLCPNDTLLVRTAAQTEQWKMADLDRAALRQPSNPWHAGAEKAFPGGWNGRAGSPVAGEGPDEPDYYAVKLPDDTVNFGFERELAERIVRPDAALAELFARWYGDDDYAFRSDEVIQFLRQDQENRGVENAAIVLPGGGVKGAYQARLLDFLYDDHLIANDRDPRRALAPGALDVRHIVGTSGGAMVGFFAAQRSVPPHPLAPTFDDFLASRQPAKSLIPAAFAAPPASSAASKRLRLGDLARLWITDGNEVLARPGTIFPPADLPRWATLWVILVLFSLLLHRRIPYLAVTREVPISWLPLPAEPPERKIRLLLLAMIIATPLAARAVARTTPNYVALGEGIAYALVVLVGHYAYASSGRNKVGHSTKRAWYAVAVGGGIMACLLTNFFVGRSIADLSACAALTSNTGWELAAIALLLVGVLLRVRAVSGETPVEVKLAYLSAILALLAVFAGAFLAVWLATALGLASTLELTRNYWLAVLLGGGLTTWMLAGYAFRKPETGMRKAVAAGLLFWITPQRKRLLASPIRALVFGSGIALLLWTLIAAPGLYSGCRAFETFSAMQDRFGGGKADRYTLFSNLIVTTTSFGTQPKPEGIYQGDYYCCTEGDEGCEQMAAQRGNVIRFPKDRFVGAVFASGSPFPIFPPRALLPTAGRDSVDFIDGGYTHNVPLEGAEIVGAQQVLLIRSAAPPVDDHGSEAVTQWGSHLALGSWNLIPFLFERSQEIDKGASGKMVVASLAPDPERGDSPFLMDFRDDTVRSLVRDAAVDYLSGRIGRVEAWGVPRLYRRIAPSGRT
jgi:predicted acylesterase/phospholipase RssA